MPDTQDTNLNTEQQDISRAELANQVQHLAETIENATAPLKTLQAAVKDLSHIFQSSKDAVTSQLKQNLQSTDQLAKSIEQTSKKAQDLQSKHVSNGTNNTAGQTQTQRATSLSAGYAKETKSSVEGLTANFAKYVDIIDKIFKEQTDATKQLTKTYGDILKNPKGELLKRGREWAAGVGARVSTTVGGGLGAVLGFGAGTLANLAVMAAKNFLDQVGKGVKDYFSWNVIGGNWGRSFGVEARLGNFLGTGDNRIDANIYSAYRNRMRLMGERDDSRIAASIQQLAEVGIGGGINRADAISAALSRQSIKSVFGIDVSAQTAGSLYRSTGMSRPTALYENGAFDLQKMFQRLAITVEKTANVFGGQTGLNELYGIIQSLSQHFRGLDNDMDRFVSGLSVYSKLISENAITAKQAEDLLSASRRISTGKQFEMLAWAGVQGGDFFKEREQFMRRGAQAVGSQENAREFAKAMLGYYNTVGGDEYQRSYFLREKLQDMGYGDLATNVIDPKQLLEKVAAGDNEATKTMQDNMKSQVGILNKQAEKLDAIQNPVEHIRDLLFGMIDRSDVGKFAKNAALNFAEFGARLGGVSDSAINEALAKGASGGKEGQTEEVIDALKDAAAATRENTRVKSLALNRYNSATLIGGSDS